MSDTPTPPLPPGATRVGGIDMRLAATSADGKFGGVGGIPNNTLFCTLTLCIPKDLGPSHFYRLIFLCRGYEPRPPTTPSSNRCWQTITMWPRPAVHSSKSSTILVGKSNRMAEVKSATLRPASLTTKAGWSDPLRAGKYSAARTARHVRIVALRPIIN